MDDITDGQFGDLAGPCAGNISDRDDLCRDMARGAIGADALLDRRDQIIGQFLAILHAHEQHNAGVIVPTLSNDDGFLHVRERFDLAVNLRRANPHATGIQRRIRPAIDGKTVMVRLRNEIAMGPDVRILLKIGGVIALACLVAPKANRHTGEGLHTYQFSLFAGRGRFALVVIDLHRHAQARRLDFTAPDRLDRIAQHEATDNIGPARNGA